LVELPIENKIVNFDASALQECPDNGINGHFALKSIQRVLCVGIGENANLGKQSVFNNKTVIWSIITLLSGLNERLCLLFSFFFFFLPILAVVFFGN
jgi:hypothetical protein